jgi:hypothetical protein
MAENERDAEIRALEVLIDALEPLDDDARARVLEYTLRRLGMREMPAAKPLAAEPIADHVEAGPHAGADRLVDIRTLREEKAPKTANEMAAVVAYYLAEAAPEAERKQTVTTADLERLFKQAGYPLPSRIGNTLANAAAAGYFDNAGRGEYRLNPVGFNLVTQNLPRSGGQAQSGRRRGGQSPRRAATRKQSTSSSKRGTTRTRSTKKKRPS